LPNPEGVIGRRHSLWKVVFAQRDEYGRERIYLRFRDLVPVNRALRQTGYAHDEPVDPVTHCPVCGQPNRPE
jgi:hypothetical protein